MSAPLRINKADNPSDGESLRSFAATLVAGGCIGSIVAIAIVSWDYSSTLRQQALNCSNLYNVSIETCTDAIGAHNDFVENPTEEQMTRLDAYFRLNEI